MLFIQNSTYFNEIQHRLKNLEMFKNKLENRRELKVHFVQEISLKQTWEQVETYGRERQK